MNFEVVYYTYYNFLTAQALSLVYGNNSQVNQLSLEVPVKHKKFRLIIIYTVKPLFIMDTLGTPNFGTILPL